MLTQSGSHFTYLAPLAIVCAMILNKVSKSMIGVILCKKMIILFSQGLDLFYTLT